MLAYSSRDSERPGKIRSHENTTINTKYGICERTSRRLTSSFLSNEKVVFCVIMPSVMSLSNVVVEGKIRIVRFWSTLTLLEMLSSSTVSFYLCISTSLSLLPNISLHNSSKAVEDLFLPLFYSASAFALI